MKFKSSVDDAANAGGYDAGNIIKMSSFEFDVPYKFRALSPIIPVHRVMYPCLVPDDKNPGLLRQSWRAVRLPMKYAAYDWQKQPTIVDLLKKLDLDIRRQNRVVGTSEEIKSFFEPQKLWVIPVFDRRDSEILIKFLEAGWMIFDGIRQLQNAPDEDDPTRLAFGPYWVHDVVIRKVKKEGNQRDAYKTAYRVKEAKDNPFAGRLDKSVLDKENQKELYNKSVEYGVFTQEEYDMLQLFSEEAEMLPLYQPQTPEEILEQFAEAPLCLDAQNRDHALIFPSPKDFSDLLLGENLTHGSLEYGLIQIPAQTSAAPVTGVEKPSTPGAETAVESPETAQGASSAASPVKDTAPEGAGASSKDSGGGKLSNLMGPKKVVDVTPEVSADKKPAGKKEKPAFLKDFDSEV